MQLIGSSALVQSPFPGPTGRARALLRAPALHALVLRTEGQTNRLEHHTRDQGRPDHGWARGTSLSDAATAPGALALAGRTLVALVPEVARTSCHELSDPAGGTWRAAAPLPVADAVAATTGAGRVHALTTSNGRVTHWRRAADGAWVELGVLPRETTGQPALAASGTCLVAALPTARGTEVLVAEAASWRRLGVIAPATGAPAMTDLGDGTLLLGVPGSLGTAFHRGRANAPGLWPVVAERRHPGDGTQVSGLALVRSSLGGGLDVTRLGLGVVNLGGLNQRLGGRRGWVQALVQEDASVYQWHREARGWARAGCLRSDPGPAVRAELASAKAAQISGETDSQPHRAGPESTLSRSESTSGVRGTDLGVRVDVQGTTLMLFGDTHWGRRFLATRDSLARVDDPDADRPRFTFHGGPLRFVGRGTTMTEYDVPLDAFELGEHWYAFTSSNHFARHKVMGRSVLARALTRADAASGRTRMPFWFRSLATVSDDLFVNISCQWVPRSLVSPDAPADAPALLGLWGTGTYRADDLRFAVLDAHALQDRLEGPWGLSTAALGLQFFAGLHDGAPVWSSTEVDAASVLPGPFGEVSVRWVPALGRFVFLVLSGPEDPAGGTVLLYASETPWGPWTQRLVLFDWIADGLSFGDPSRRFIRAFATDDPVGDEIFGAQAGKPGGAYAPYLYDAVPDGEGVRVRYTLSTWNPYQVVLMEHHLSARDLDALGVEAPLSGSPR